MTSQKNIFFVEHNDDGLNAFLSMISNAKLLSIILMAAVTKIIYSNRFDLSETNINWIFNIVKGAKQK